jgi:Two component regulator propeller
MAGLDHEGAFWVATNAGLDEFDRSTGRVARHISLPETPVRLTFLEDRRGVFWIICGQEGQLLTLDRKSGHLRRLMPTVGTPLAGSGHVLFSTMIEDRDGTMWFGTDNGGILQFD